MNGVLCGRGAVVGRVAWSGGDKEVAERQLALLRRARFLPAADQALLRLVLEGHTMREVGAVVGLSAGAACRRARRLMDRLRDPAVVVLIDFPAELPEEYRQAGIAHLLVGMPARAIAAAMEQSEREVRAMLAYVRGWTRIAQHLWAKLLVEKAERRKERMGDETPEERVRGSGFRAQERNERVAGWGGRAVVRDLCQTGAAAAARAGGGGGVPDAGRGADRADRRAIGVGEIDAAEGVSQAAGRAGAD